MKISFWYVPWSLLHCLFYNSLLKLSEISNSHLSRCSRCNGSLGTRSVEDVSALGVLEGFLCHQKVHMNHTSSVLKNVGVVSESGNTVFAFCTVVGNEQMAPKLQAHIPTSSQGRQIIILSLSHVVSKLCCQTPYPKRGIQRFSGNFLPS